MFKRWAALLSLGLLAMVPALQSAWSGPPQGDAARREQIDTLFARYQTQFSQVPTVEVADLLPRLDDPTLLLVDVRPPEERAVSMLPGAVPKEQVEANPTAYADREIVAYCTIGVRSGLWAAEMREKGLNVQNLKGSVLSWTHAGGPLRTPEGEATKRVHVYSKSWDYSAAGYEPVW